MSENSTIVNTILSEKVSAIIRVGNKTIAESSMEAAIEGGFKVIEFTLTTPGALDLISQYTENVVYGFDTFSGLDYSWQGTLSGSMKFFDIGGIPPTSVIPINPDVRNGLLQLGSSGGISIIASGNISGSYTSTGSFGSLIVDGAHDRVGIGTKTPTVNLDMPFGGVR